MRVPLSIESKYDIREVGAYLRNGWAKDRIQANREREMLQRFIPCAVLLFLLNACALTVDTIDIAYKPGPAARIVPAQESVVVDLDVQDARTSYLDRVSSKKNGYGMEMAAIVSKRDVRSMVIDAFRTELERRGFSVGESPISIKTRIHKFYSDFKVGFFSG
jgi:uncharacterized lipoprotein